MRNFELHILDSGEDIILALDSGLVDELPTECAACGAYLTVPFTVSLGEDDISVSRCTDCLPLP